MDADKDNKDKEKKLDQKTIDNLSDDKEKEIRKMFANKFFANPLNYIIEIGDAMIWKLMSSDYQEMVKTEKQKNLLKKDKDNKNP